MNRTEKKCFLGSAAFHGLLAVTFLFGSAFFTSHSKNNNVPPPITVIPEDAVKFVDGQSSGGKPGAPPPAKAAQPDKPAPVARAEKPPPPIAKPADKPVVKPPETLKPPKADKPKEPKQVAHEDKPEKHHGDDVPPKSKNIKKVTNTATNETHRLTDHVVKRSTVDLAAIRAQEAADAEAAQAERAYQDSLDRARKWQDVAGIAAGKIGGLGKGLTDRVVSVDGQNGLGNGPATANWRAAVGLLYTRAWVPPSDADASSTVDARVTIARNGDVLSAHVVRSSGNASLDRSVERVLRKVRQAPPLPDNAREDQRTVTITFDLNVKQALG